MKLNDLDIDVESIIAEKQKKLEKIGLAIDEYNDVLNELTRDYKELGSQVLFLKQLQNLTKESNTEKIFNGVTEIIGQYANRNNPPFPPLTYNNVTYKWGK